MHVFEGVRRLARVFSEGSPRPIVCLPQMNSQGYVATIFLYICAVTSAGLFLYYMYKVCWLCRLAVFLFSAKSNLPASLPPLSRVRAFPQYQKKQCGWEGAFGVRGVKGVGVA